MSWSRIVRYTSEALRLVMQRRFGVLREKGSRVTLASGPTVSADELASLLAELGSVVCIVDGAQGGGAAAAARRSASHRRNRIVRAEGDSNLQVPWFLNPLAGVALKLRRYPGRWRRTGETGRGAGLKFIANAMG